MSVTLIQQSWPRPSLMPQAETFWMTIMLLAFSEMPQRMTWSPLGFQMGSNSYSTLFFSMQRGYSSLHTSQQNFQKLYWMVPPTTSFFTLDWFHFSKQRKCTNPQEPLHLQGLHKKPSGSSVWPMQQYLHSSLARSIQLFSPTIIFLVIDQNLALFSPCQLALAEVMRYSTLPNLTTCPFSKIVKELLSLQPLFQLFLFFRDRTMRQISSSFLGSVGELEEFVRYEQLPFFYLMKLELKNSILCRLLSCFNCRQPSSCRLLGTLYSSSELTSKLIQQSVWYR